MNIVSIVEGDGEVRAVPVLFRRLAERYGSGTVYPQIMPPIRVQKDRFLNRPEEFERHLLFAAKRSGDAGWILVLLDADDACPAETGREIYERASRIVPHRKLSVVLANREFEAWFIAGAESLEGCRGFSMAGSLPHDPETKRNAKGWMKERMNGGAYGALTDQVAFVAQVDLDLTHQRSRSFRKLCTEWSKNVIGDLAE